MLGTALGVEHSTLTNLKDGKNFPTKTESEKMGEVLTKLARQERLTYRMVYDTLTTMSKNSLAQDLEANHPNMDDEGK